MTFFKCDDFKVLLTISIKYYGNNFIASPLQPWYFDSKPTSEKNSYLRYVLGITNKES